MTIAGPEPTNTHPILDPVFSAHQVRKHFASWIDLEKEMARYAADLLLRSLKDAPKNRASLVVLGVLYRQNIVAFDGALSCLESGAVHAAIPLNRALLEASFGLDWMLRDVERLSAQFYVSSVRENLIWIRRGIPGTSEHSDFLAECKAMPYPLDTSPELVAARQAEEGQLTATLNNQTYKSYNDAVEAYRNPPSPQKRRSEPKWYAYGSEAVSNVADMARKLGRGAEYMAFYKYGSYHVHGSLADSHFYRDGGSVRIYPVRDLRLFPTVLTNTATLMLQTIKTVTERYRPGEVINVDKNRLRPWARAIRQLASATITLNPEAVEL